MTCTCKIQVTQEQHRVLMKNIWTKIHEDKNDTNCTKKGHLEGPGYYITSSASLKKAVTHSRTIWVWRMGDPRGSQRGMEIAVGSGEQLARQVRRV